MKVRMGVAYPGFMSDYVILRAVDFDKISGPQLKTIIKKGLDEIKRSGEGEFIIVPEKYARY